jgi:hypothetical protein
MATLLKQPSNNQIIDARYESEKHRNQQDRTSLKNTYETGRYRAQYDTPKREKKCPQNHRETGDVEPKMTTENRF